MTQETLKGNQDLKLSLQQSIGPIQPQASSDEKKSYKEVMAAFKRKVSKIQKTPSIRASLSQEEKSKESQFDQFQGVIEELIEQSRAYDRHYLETGERQDDIET